MDLNASRINGSGIKGLHEYRSDAELASQVLFEDYPDSLLVFASACCVLFMVIGIPGNFITILALARYKKCLNATSIFIMNLSLSDLLFCCFNLPLAASTFWRQSWAHGRVLCRMFPMARYALVAVSIFTILAITINRYIMISHPLLYPKIYKTRYIALMIVSIWITSFGALIATYFEQWGQFSLDTISGSCTIVPDKDGRSPKQFVFIIAFVLPSLAIIMCYARIFWIVKKTSQKSKPQQFQAIMRIKPIIQIQPTIAEVPETSIPSEAEIVVQQRTKTHLSLPCFYPELSSCNDSSSREDNENKCAPEFKGSPLNSERAKRIRQSFVDTFRRSTALIRPRLPTKKDKRLQTMIVAIITSFLICHLPITLTKTIFSEFSHPVLNVTGYILIYVTTCINPIIYVVMSVEYRQAYKNLFKCR